MRNPENLPAKTNSLANAWAMSVGGVMPARPLAAVVRQAEEEAHARAEAANAEPLVQNLAAHVRKSWSDARDARREVTDDMLDAARAREGRYPPRMEALLQQQGGSTVYMMLFSTKARQAKALVGDVLLSSGAEKPWTVAPTPEPDLPEDIVGGILQGTARIVAEAEMSGAPMTQEEISRMLRDARDKVTSAIAEEAKHRSGRLESHMEDMLIEGGFYAALDEFLDHLMTYRTAFIKGPVIRRKPVLRWQQTQQGYEPTVSEELLPTWYAPDPMKIYPSKGARSVQDGYLCELHDLTVDALHELIGAPGYSEDAIRSVIAEWGLGSLSDWATNDRPDTDRPLTDEVAETVQAVQYWGRVTGSMLREWGVPEDEVPSATDYYDAEVWLIGRWVIKAMLVSDPLQRRPYYAASFAAVPGRFWGKSLYDTMKDCEAMCNAAARALDVNMGISSGPQVGINVDRMADGEEVTAMFPWKIWQFGGDPTGSNAQPMWFFQPTSNAHELMGIYDRFAVLADEYTGIPRYMTGLAGGDGGAGRTASGMSMMIGNANKTIKALVSAVDIGIFVPLLEQLHVHIMRYGEDPDAKGDVSIVARGALALAVKEAAQVRRNEFLAATANPIDMQIVGLEGRAALLREAAKALDINPDLVVPPLSELRMRAKIAEQQAQMAQMAQMAPDGGQPGGAAAGAPDQTKLMNGAPVTQHFDPQPKPAPVAG